MSKFDLKLKVSKLRRKGQSIKDIARIVGVSKSTVSVWCKDIVLNKKQKSILNAKMIAAGHSGRVKGARVNREKKVSRILEAQREAKVRILNIADDSRFLVGVSLYWAEGSKKDNKYAFSNSDPKVILFMAKWLMDYFDIPKSDLMPRLYINSVYQDRVGSLLTFWETLLELPSKQFGNPVLLKIRNKKVYNNSDSYKGLISLRVKNSTYLMHRVIALIDVLKNNLSG
jgi:transposase-like protein